MLTERVKLTVLSLSFPLIPSSSGLFESYSTSHGGVSVCLLHRTGLVHIQTTWRLYNDVFSGKEKSSFPKTQNRAQVHGK